MNTPAHLLLGAAALGQGRRLLIWAGFLGALLPDLSLYLMAGAALYLWQIPAQVVFGELYYSAPWQTVFAIDNSMLVWGALLAVALWRQWQWGITLCGAALLHLALDLPLHHDDGRPHFWPLSEWVFASPLSYWDVRHGAAWVAPVEMLVALASAGVVLWQRPGWAITAMVGFLVLAQLAVGRMFAMIFA